ncbi:MAG: hypothetical protein RBR87_10840 [Bacteroidales bacterium]|jgi:hypothetical protein|nr:hypothetical protein [Bacteroidales bacterium]
MFSRKYFILILLLFPLISMGQKGVSLLPSADVIFHEKTIFYIIPFDANEAVAPLSFPQIYRTEYLQTVPRDAHFDKLESMLQYLLTTSPEFTDYDESIFLLRALALYKIRNENKAVKLPAELDSSLKQFAKHPDETIAFFAKQILEI